MERFIGRERELSLIEESLTRPSAAVMIYGKRKVGKTTLLKYALQGAEATYVYYECLKSSLSDNVANFVKELDIEVLNFSESDTTEHIRFNCRHTLKIMEKGYGCIDLFPPIQVEMETEDNEQSEIHNKIKTDVIEILQKPI